MNLSQRRDQKELLDEQDIPEADLRRNLVELDIINRYLGGHRITLKAVQRLLATPHAKKIIRERPIHICEIGCGGGDNLMVIDRWAERKGIPLEITGVDMKETCTQFARARSWNNHTRWITEDYRHARFNRPPDILFSSLFCHHFSDEAMPGMLEWMHERCTCGFFINDLHRHFLAYHSIKWLTRAFSRSYLVRNDAPLSVARGFVKQDWASYFSQTGIEGSVRWKWAFRWLVMGTRTQ
jgi:2-polyprenyl-3-methyl-5-hydroxy-6-metoxy-1,4-benzoquinol methylase